MVSIKGSDKHHKNSPDRIGKPPRDGQAALDNSLTIEKSTQRVTVQDGDVIILKYEEILYLNLCDWLEPQARRINAQLKASGGLKIIDPISKTEIIIEEFDLFHSLLGEMKPQFLNNVTSGGHLPLIELRSAVLEIGEIKPIGNGFFDMVIKRGSNRKTNSYFPIGTSVEQAVEIIESAIKNPKNISQINLKDTALKGLKFTNQQGQDFAILIKNKTMQFYPIKPELIK